MSGLRPGEIRAAMPAILLAAINAKWIHPSLALRLLKANLGRLEDQCEIMEFALRQPLNEKVDPILAARPRLLALSVSIWNHQATLELLKTLEAKWIPHGQKPIIVLGGPEVSWLPKNAEIFQYADYVIRGEGEESFRSLCFRLFYGEENVSYTFTKERTGDKDLVFINEGNTAVDLDKIAPAYYLYTGEDLKRKLIYVESSRGCPFECEFCLGPARPRGLSPVREFPLEPFLADMGNLISRGARQFKFLDRSFNLNIDRAIRIMGFFLDRITAPAEVPVPSKEKPLCVHFEMVPGRFPPALKEVLRRFPPGSLRIELGIQTFNAETAALIKRSDNSGETLETLKFLRAETNAIIHADLIAGLPGESLASFGAGFDLLWQALSGTPGLKSSGSRFTADRSFEIQLGILKCLPGTPISRHNKTFGMKYSAGPPYEVLESAAMPAPEIVKIKNFARFWEIIVNRGHFPELTARLFPPGESVFGEFMKLSQKLLENFGRNWGIDRTELGKFLVSQ